MLLKVDLQVVLLFDKVVRWVFFNVLVVKNPDWILAQGVSNK
jgi:hypothetical protein